jgi:hypothetical protein
MLVEYAHDLHGVILDPIEDRIGMLEQRPKPWRNLVPGASQQRLGRKALALARWSAISGDATFE